MGYLAALVTYLGRDMCSPFSSFLESLYHWCDMGILFYLQLAKIGGYILRVQFTKIYKYIFNQQPPKMGNYVFIYNSQKMGEVAGVDSVP